MFVVGGMMLAVGVVGHQDLFFHGRILEELALAMLEYADDAVRKSFDVNDLVQRIAVREKCLAEIVADDGDVRAVQIFRFGEIPANVGPGVEDILVVDIRSGIIQAADFLVLVARGDQRRAIEVIDALEYRHGHFLHRRALLADGQRVFIASMACGCAPRRSCVRC